MLTCADRTAALFKWLNICSFTGVPRTGRFVKRTLPQSVAGRREASSVGSGQGGCCAGEAMSRGICRCGFAGKLAECGGFYSP
ncbi:hypothetical protein [Pelobacter seleniigenes]|uniref:hypothetical protein n=1 Tax=Pelobacter seleniigenes TaxID=407188 RepID=UPI0004A6FA73|nr:hypothetical protein [Pelobacter seleniigenes]